MNDAAAKAPPAEEFGFEADVAQLLELMTHSVYSERDVFLRELISNAADACEKLRYESLSNEKLAPLAGAPLVTITLDKDKRQLTVADNGVGMSRDELISALGAIANSGTRAFIEKASACSCKFHFDDELRSAAARRPSFPFLSIAPSEERAHWRLHDDRCCS
jgi:molecular chaperone HtpG